MVPIHLMNAMLKTKWLWRYTTDEEASWKKVIATKYAPLHGGIGVHGHKGWVVGNNRSLADCEVISGSRVLFWHDTGCGKPE